MQLLFAWWSPEIPSSSSSIYSSNRCSSYDMRNASNVNSSLFVSGGVLTYFTTMKIFSSWEEEIPTFAGIWVSCSRLMLNILLESNQMIKKKNENEYMINTKKQNRSNLVLTWIHCLMQLSIAWWSPEIPSSSSSISSSNRCSPSDMHDSSNVDSSLFVSGEVLTSLTAIKISYSWEEEIPTFARIWVSCSRLMLNISLKSNA